MKLLVKLTLHRLRNGINVYMLVKRTRLSLVQIIVEKKKSAVAQRGVSDE